MMNQSESLNTLSADQFEDMFPDDEACAEDLFRRRWPDGFVCPDCGSGNAVRLQRARCVHQCRDCRKQTSVTAGTFMHRSHVPLRTWHRAICIMTSHSNGMSALQLQSHLGLGSYKTAWTLVQKIRRAMEVADGFSLIMCYYRIKTPQKRRSKIPQLRGCEFVPGGMPPERKQSRIPSDFFAAGGSNRMIGLERIVMLQELKRYCLSISAITRRTGMDRKTVRKLLDRGLAAPTYSSREPRLRRLGRTREPAGRRWTSS